MSQNIGSLAVGSLAPNFELSDQHGVKVSLSTFRDKKNVVLLFYPFSFTGTCTGELCEIRDDLNAFQNDEVQLLAISCDSIFSQRLFAQEQGYEFPVLSDFWPHGEVSKAYGVFNEARGCAIRGTFIVDKKGILRWRVVNVMGDVRNALDYKTAIAAL
ncbi:MAG: peroxiredoxin [Candidatus Nanopelagicaceae bacterium]|nr:peroxiredoxin [Candidatus Nanopelagicaceae bacterium]